MLREVCSEATKTKAPKGEAVFLQEPPLLVFPRAQAPETSPGREHVSVPGKPVNPRRRGIEKAGLWLRICHPSADPGKPLNFFQPGFLPC